MKINYVIYHSWTELQTKILKGFGIVVSTGWARIEIEEDTYIKLDKYFSEWGVDAPSVGTLYEKKEIEKADHLMLKGVWVNGYPQPEEYLEMLALTYDLSNFCSACGIGTIQKRPFRIKGQPKWNKSLLFEINWIFDELFVRTDIYEKVFQPLGIDCWPVFKNKKDETVADTVQLILPISQEPLKLESQKFCTCKSCGRKKYSPQIAGYYPNFKSIPTNTGIFKSQEYFGFDTNAFRSRIITKALYNEVRKSVSKISVAPMLK